MVLVVLCLLLQPSPGRAQERVYVLSYSPGTLFHSLVRDRVKVVYERAGIPVMFVPLPHKRSISDANDGLVDGEVGRVTSVEKNAPNLRRVDVKLMDLVGAAYVRRSNDLEYSDILLDVSEVGIVRGVQWAQKVMQGRDVTAVNDYQTLFDMLAINRIDLALATTASADSVLDKKLARHQGIRMLQPPLFSAPIYHYVNKKNADLIPRLEKALRGLHQEHYWSKGATH